jgi:hypothetical protein
MNKLNRWTIQTLGVSAIGAALLTSGPAKANCNVVQYTLATTAFQQYPASDSCQRVGGQALLDYEVSYLSIIPGSGINYISQYAYSGPNSGYYDGVFAFCANVGWINSGWTANQSSAGSPPPGGYPPSSFAQCPNGDTAEEAEGYVYVPS